MICNAIKYDAETLQIGAGKTSLCNKIFGLKPEKRNDGDKKTFIREFHPKGDPGVDFLACSGEPTQEREMMLV